MRARHWILCGFAAFLAAGVSATGCGGSSGDNTTTDAGQDVTAADVVAEAAHDTGPIDTGANACTSDADLNNLNAPDASLGDGASSVGLCVSCVHTQCTTELKACNDDCDCRGAVVDLFTCVASGTSLLTCAAPLVAGGLSGNSQALGQSLGFCVYSGCKNQCAPNIDAAILDGAFTDVHNDAPGEGG